MIESIAKKDKNVKAFKFQRNYGKSPALHVGFEAVGQVCLHELITATLEQSHSFRHSAFLCQFVECVLDFKVLIHALIHAVDDATSVVWLERTAKNRVL